MTERALVLGGGGAAGNAWEIGVLAGLFDKGVDVTDADLVIGTSAGATVAAQLSGARPDELYAQILAEPAPPRRATTGPVRAAADMMSLSADIIATATDPADMRRRLGQAALTTPTTPDSPAQVDRRATVAARLPSPHWPTRRTVIVAVDAHTGEPVLFDRDSGVELADAVAASTANGFGPFPAYAIGANRYIDGGYRRSSENADLAAGHKRVLVLSPFGGRSRMPPEWRMDLAAQTDELRSGGSAVETVMPDDNELFGANAMDLSARQRAAQAGYQQGGDRAEQLSHFWH